MTMRAVIDRPIVETNSWGEKSVIGYQPLGSVPCFAWYDDKALVIDSDKIASVGDIKALVPIGSGMRAGDVVRNVLDRAGAVRFQGPMVAKTVVRRSNHLLAELESHVS